MLHLQNNLKISMKLLVAVHFLMLITALAQDHRRFTGSQSIREILSRKDLRHVVVTRDETINKVRRARDLLIITKDNNSVVWQLAQFIKPDVVDESGAPATVNIVFVCEEWKVGYPIIFGTITNLNVSLNELVETCKDLFGTNKDVTYLVAPDILTEGNVPGIRFPAVDMYKIAAQRNYIICNHLANHEAIDKKD
jgi:hypothetical protein